MVTTEAHRFASFAALLADETRAAFCLALLDGRTWTAGELARHAGVAASTASAHLTRLVAAGVLAEVRQGRHRYLRLADVETADLIERLTAHLPRIDDPPRGLREVRAEHAMVQARTCYDHLAGRLGVAIADAMAARGLLARESGLAITERGRAWFADLGADPATWPRRRPAVRECLDWTERRPHLAGACGAVLYRILLDRAWLVRTGDRRAVRVTPEGGAALRELLGLDWPDRPDRPDPAPPTGRDPVHV
ncbi:DNA-binding transcriptional ArsR family regulator [Spinactinospora alkalitolerans]|uniref:DNA-binding transcriptional ArsR family regulator n=1 Tax=Spinactinospora alkalitolerans TaxID=687207 RepID=A0A852TPD5_9ACTN|nr:winged helix-turn-helix domain-containing protein [Spinactinospora alkalitolerans]NYE46216.1 DNA-binding transcriptional ArsR family regulator [Spinactinospora alkalitolerans]